MGTAADAITSGQGGADSRSGCRSTSRISRDRHLRQAVQVIQALPNLGDRSFPRRSFMQNHVLL